MGLQTHCLSVRTRRVPAPHLTGRDIAEHTGPRRDRGAVPDPDVPVEPGLPPYRDPRPSCVLPEIPTCDTMIEPAPIRTL
jgi:hypothetical protein